MSLSACSYNPALYGRYLTRIGERYPFQRHSALSILHVVQEFGSRSSPWDFMSRHAGKNVKQAVLVSSVVPYMLKTDTNPAGVDHVTFEKMAAGIKADRAKFWSSFFKDFYGVGIVSHPTSDEVLEWSRGVAMQASLKATLDCAASFAAHKEQLIADVLRFLQAPAMMPETQASGMRVDLVHA